MASAIYTPLDLKIAIEAVASEEQRKPHVVIRRALAVYRHAVENGLDVERIIGCNSNPHGGVGDGKS